MIGTGLDDNETILHGMGDPVYAARAVPAGDRQGSVHEAEMIGAWAAYFLWWGMTVLAFGAIIMLTIDAITFLGGKPDRTITNTFQRFFGGSKESWRSAMFGFILGVILTHLTGWGAIPPQLP